MSGEGKIRVVVVDDSAFMRTVIERILKSDSSIEVAGSAANGKEAVEKISRLRPDVVTMDVEMPVMGGLHALKEVMRICPVPVIMVSSLTQEGARITLDALDLGAVDYVAKPGSKLSLTMLDLKQELIEKVRSAASSEPKIPKYKFRPPPPKVSSAILGPVTYLTRVVVVGASTGGPPALQQLLATLPAKLPAPMIIAQHMPKAFTGAFASRLNQICSIRVKEAIHGEVVQQSVAYICPGDFQTRFNRLDNGSFAFSVTPNSLEKLRYAPSIDALFFSASESFGRNAIGIILTGMGEDGVRGLKNIKLVGGLTIVQDRASSVVYGMPRAALEQGAVTRVLALSDIPNEVEIALK